MIFLGHIAQGHLALVIRIGSRGWKFKIRYSSFHCKFPEKIFFSIRLNCQDAWKIPILSKPCLHHAPVSLQMVISTLWTSLTASIEWKSVPLMPLVAFHSDSHRFFFFLQMVNGPNPASVNRRVGSNIS